jgi:hypothetical protein
MSKKTSIKKAIESISSGDARGLRKHINEALVSKVRKALDTKEKEIARNLIESSTKTPLKEAKLQSTEKSIVKNELIDLAKKGAGAGQDVIDLLNRAYGSSSTISLAQLGDKMRATKMSKEQEKTVGMVFFVLSCELN